MKQKPNVLILFSDQQRYDTICAAGYSHMITPNLDRLMREGCYYPNAHSANPVCMPARHDLITGLSARNHGYYTNSETCPISDYSIPTLPRLFSENGYRTAAIGKMHFYPPREHHGFGEMRLMEELPKRRQDDQYAMYLEKEGQGEIQNIHGIRPHIYHIPQRSVQDLKHHGTNWVADETIRWIKENGQSPFFIMSSFIKPHPPWNIPAEMENAYEGAVIPEPIPRSRLVHDEEYSPWFGDDETKEQQESIRKAYYTAVTMVDQAIGKILDFLREQGKLEDTVVIFNSDHGEMLRDKGYYSKELPYDSSVRVPLIIRYPKKIRGGTRDERFADTFDLLPTCLDLCGLSYPGGYKLLGESLFKPGEKNREVQISATGLGLMRWVMVRNKQYKYVYHYNGGVKELYDMLRNPDETVNLLNRKEGLKKEAAEAFARLEKTAVKYEECHGPEGCVTDGVFQMYEFQKLHPSVRGKFHFWSNHQMQLFFPEEKRGEVLMKEMRTAVPFENTDHNSLPPVFENKEWLADFEQGFLEYCGKEAEKRKTLPEGTS